MRTSLNNIKENEDFIHKTMNPQHELLFSARLLLDPFLRINLALQQKTHSLINSLARRKLKNEILSVQESIFNDPTQIKFLQQINQLFLKP